MDIMKHKKRALSLLSLFFFFLVWIVILHTISHTILRCFVNKEDYSWQFYLAFNLIKSFIKNYTVTS